MSPLTLFTFYLLFFFNFNWYQRKEIKKTPNQRCQEEMLHIR